MTRNNKIAVTIILISLILFFIFYIRQMKIQGECKKKYTICMITNIRESITSKIYGDFYIKNGNELIVKKDFVITSTYTKNKGKNYITKGGFYFIDYCVDHPELRTIYTEIFPSDVDSTFLDSSWNTPKEMDFYTYTKERRNEIRKYKDSVSKGTVQ